MISLSPPLLEDSILKSKEHTPSNHSEENVLLSTSSVTTNHRTEITTFILSGSDINEHLHDKKKKSIIKPSSTSETCMDTSLNVHSSFLANNPLSIISMPNPTHFDTDIHNQKSSPVVPQPSPPPSPTSASIRSSSSTKTVKLGVRTLDQIQAEREHKQLAEFERSKIENLFSPTRYNKSMKVAVPSLASSGRGVNSTLVKRTMPNSPGHKRTCSHTSCSITEPVPERCNPFDSHSYEFLHSNCHVNSILPKFSHRNMHIYGSSRIYSGVTPSLPPDVPSDIHLHTDGNTSETNTTLSKGSSSNILPLDNERIKIENGALGVVKRVSRSGGSLGRFLITPLQKKGLKNRSSSNNLAMFYNEKRSKNSSLNFNENEQIYGGSNSSSVIPQNPRTFSVSRRKKSSSITHSQCTHTFTTYSQPILFGYLHKLGRHGSWQTRWFETNGCTLQYFTNKQRSKLLATLDIQKVGEIFLDTSDPLKCTFIIQVAKRNYFLSAERTEVAKDWVICLNRIKEARLEIGGLKLIEPLDFFVDRNDVNDDIREEGSKGDKSESDDDFTPRVVMVASRIRTKAIGKNDVVDKKLMILNSTENIKKTENLTSSQNSRVTTFPLSHHIHNDDGEVGFRHSQSLMTTKSPQRQQFVRDFETLSVRWRKRRSSFQNWTRRISRWARRMTMIRCVVKDDVVHLNQQHRGSRIDSNSNKCKEGESINHININKQYNIPHSLAANNQSCRVSIVQTDNNKVCIQDTDGFGRDSSRWCKHNESFVDMDFDSTLDQIRNNYIQQPVLNLEGQNSVRLKQISEKDASISQTCIPKSQLSAVSKSETSHVRTSDSFDELIDNNISDMSPPSTYGFMRTRNVIDIDDRVSVPYVREECGGSHHSNGEPISKGESSSGRKSPCNFDDDSGVIA